MSVDVKIEIDWHKKIKTGTIYLNGKFYANPKSQNEVIVIISELMGCPRCGGECRSDDMGRLTRITCSNCGYYFDI